MSFLLIILLLTNTPAQAGWLSDFCSRHLIADDPYQYDDYLRTLTDAELTRMQERELIRVRWGKKPLDQTLFNAVSSEIKRRVTLGESLDSGDQITHGTESTIQSWDESQ